MGSAPLPADLRKICDCTGGCDKTWQGPQKRFWLTWPFALQPRYANLAAGILMEIFPPSIEVQLCRWLPATAFGPFTSLFMERTGQSPSTGTGGGWEVRGLSVILEEWSGGDAFTPDNCEGVKGLPEVIDTFTPAINSPVTVTPVRWWEDADDVPH